MRGRYTLLFAACFLFFNSVVPPDTGAKNLLVRPSLEVKGEYDDNVAFDETDPDSDYLLTVSPAASMAYDSEVVQLFSKIAFDIRRYQDQTDLNTVNQFYDLNGAYRLGERWTLTGLISYIKDTTLDTQLLEIGRTTVRLEDRRRFDIDAGGTYQLSELSDLGLNYHFKDVEFERDDSVDFDRHSIALSYSRKLKNQVDVLSALPEYYHRDSEVSDFDEVIFLVGWSHLFSPLTQFYIASGVSYSEQDFKDDRSTDQHWDVVGDTYLKGTGEVIDYTVGFRRDIRTGNRGRALNVNRLYLRSKWRLTSRFDITFRGNLHYSSDVDKSSGDDVRLFRLRPAVNYNITENHFLQLGYRYSHKYDKERKTDQKRDRNQIWLSLNFNFPKEWDF